MSTGSVILSSLYFFLPAYIANMMPVLVMKIPFLGKPVSSRLFGKNKTWRGLFFGTVAGGLIFWLQKIVYTSGFTSWGIIDYADYSLLLGFLLGFGALAGDMAKSYYKRKAGIKEGEPWIPFDQLDFVFGGIIMSFFVYVPRAEVVLVLLLASPLLHIIFNYIGYLLGLRKRMI